MMNNVDNGRNNPQIKIDNAENSLFPKKNEMDNNAWIC